MHPRKGRKPEKRAQVSRLFSSECTRMYPNVPECTLVHAPNVPLLLCENVPLVCARTQCLLGLGQPAQLLCRCFQLPPAPRPGPHEDRHGSAMRTHTQDRFFVMEASQLHVPSSSTLFIHGALSTVSRLQKCVPRGQDFARRKRSHADRLNNYAKC